MNDVPLREYMEGLAAESNKALRDHITNQIAQIKSSLDAALRAQDKFERSVAERFTQVNEFRSSLDDLGKTMSTRREAEAMGVSMEGKIDELAKQITELRSRLDTGPPTLGALQSRFDTSQGRQSGTTYATAMLTTILPILIAAIAVVVVLVK